MSWLAYNLANVADTQRPEPTVSGIAYPGSRVLVSGEPESLKSWLASVLAAEQASNRRPVIWLDFEQGPAMTRERFLALGVSHDQLANVHYYEPREPLSDDGRAELLEDVNAIRPALTVVDAYAGLLGVFDLDPDSSRDIERVNRRVVDIFRDVGSTVVILDHVVKARDNRSRYSSGSGRKLAEVEIHLGLERVKHLARGGTGYSRIRQHKDRLGGLPYPLIGELHLASDVTTGAVRWEIRPPAEGTAPTNTFRPTALMERVSVFLGLQLEPVSQNAIETTVKGKAEFVRLAIECLVTEGYATSFPGPRGSKLIESVRPYREATDLVPEGPHHGKPNVLVPLRPDLVPTSSQATPADLVPRPLPLRQDEDEVMGGRRA